MKKGEQKMCVHQKKNQSINQMNEIKVKNKLGVYVYIGLVKKGEKLRYTFWTVHTLRTSVHFKFKKI